MIELLSIFFQTFLIILTCYFPKKFSYFIYKKEISLIKRIELGVIINLFFIFCISFLYNLNNIIFFVLYIFYSLGNCYFFISDNILVKNKDKLFFFIFFVLFFLAINLIIADGVRLDWDAQKIWITKNQLFSLGGSVFDLKYSYQSEYPHLGSFLWFFYSHISFLQLEYFGRFIYVYLYLIAIFSLVNIFKLNEYFLILLSSLLVFFTFNLKLFNGYQEVLIFSLLIILINNLIYSFINSKNKNFNLLEFFIFFMIFNSIIWIKNEGSIYIIIFCLSLFFLPKLSYKSKLFFLILITIALIVKFLVYKSLGLDSLLQKGSYENLFSIDTIIVKLKFENFYIITKYLFFGLFENFIFLICVLIAIYRFFYPHKRDEFYKFNTTLILFCFGFYYLAFLLTDLDIVFHLYTAGYRLIHQFSGFSLYILYSEIIYFLPKRKT